ncbi:MAG: glycosyltransferase family 8 protein [Burkholderiales bacterium]|nr:glycosyltransferase family 8 protein [Burkholderiales bacterium]
MVIGAGAAPVRILMCFDRHYSVHAGVAVFSLLLNNPGRAFFVSLLTDGIPQHEAERFAALRSDFGASLEIRPVESSSWRHLPTLPRISLATYFRLLLPLVYAEKPGKALFLDSDLVVDADIEALWDTDVTGLVAAACRDRVGQRMRHAALRLAPTHDYFNAGVLLVDTRAWRQEQVSERALEFLQARRGEALLLDQDALNVCLQHRVRYLGGAWNFMPFLPHAHLQDDYEALVTGRLKPAIVHYAGTKKPWAVPQDPNRFMQLYWRYRRLSPWGRSAHGPSGI